ncbi:hypothetical protein [Caballeronia novacaledonica]|uniref:hypothetical protein n=1 Tax=Caballeronia novacaledonica TaxID=1544861 RepID=UPI0015E759DB|nr:hypothetical protein [Caballeronia novacaledonica]
MNRTVSREDRRTLRETVHCFFERECAPRLTRSTTVEKMASIDGLYIEIGVHPDQIVRDGKELALIWPDRCGAGSVYLF